MTKAPLRLGAEKKWIQLASLGQASWNIWAQNELTKKVKLTEEIDFSNQNIAVSDWGGFIFPYIVNFSNSTFENNAHFVDTVFHEEARFPNVNFNSCSFGNALFLKRANFSSCTFREYCSFHYAKFKSDAFFYTSNFQGETYFVNVVFHDEVRLSAVTFKRKVSFLETDFQNNVNFINSKFLGEVNFELASFSKMILFDEAFFSFAPDLRNITNKYPLSFLDTSFAYNKSTPDYIYRRLKRFAAEAQDHRTEIDLFALETKARRKN